MKIGLLFTYFPKGAQNIWTLSRDYFYFIDQFDKAGRQPYKIDEFYHFSLEMGKHPKSYFSKKIIKQHYAIKYVKMRDERNSKKYENDGLFYGRFTIPGTQIEKLWKELKKESGLKGSVLSFYRR